MCGYETQSSNKTGIYIGMRHYKEYNIHTDR